MSHEPQNLIERLFSLMEARDLDGIRALFSDVAVIYDPHYPVPTMTGCAAIQKGLTWGLATLAKPGFTVRQVWLDDSGGVVEVDTHHVLSNGMRINFEQVFVFEVENDRIRRLRSFTPNPPPGIGTWISKATGLWWKLRS